MVVVGHYSDVWHLVFQNQKFLSKLGYKDGDKLTEENASYLVGYYWATENKLQRKAFEQFNFVEWVDKDMALLGFDDAQSMI